MFGLANTVVRKAQAPTWRAAQKGRNVKQLQHNAINAMMGVT